MKFSCWITFSFLLNSPKWQRRHKVTKSILRNDIQLSGRIVTNKKYKILHKLRSLFLSSVFHQHSRMTSHLCRIRYGNTTFNGGRIKALLANIINRLREIKANCTTEMYIFEMVKRALLLNLLQISLVDIYTSWRQKKIKRKKYDVNIWSN